MAERGEEKSGPRRGLAPPAAALLIDYDNLDEFRDSVDLGRFSFLLSKIVNAYLDTVDPSFDIELLNVRLYGGWDEGGALTQRGSQVSQLLSGSDPFPMLRSGRLIYGSIELALGPLNRPGLAFSNTFRRRRGSIRIRRDPGFAHSSCPNDEQCAAKQLTKWTRKATRVCPMASCTATSAQAFLVAEQKMVDTMLTVDMLHALYFDGYASVGLVSDDSDFVPPLIHAAEQGGSGQVVLLTSQSWEQGLLDLLSDVGVTLVGVGSREH